MAITKIGKYEVIREIGRGGMGVVYEARDPDIDRHVAIKTIRIDALDHKENKRRAKLFVSEARHLGRLEHPNIVRIYDFGHLGDNAYLVMQYVEGRSLKETLASGRKLTLQDVGSLVGTLCRALQLAHKQGVIHRDIKPANILLDRNGRPILVDFGIARLDRGPTQTNTRMGTPSYMSPEQVTSEAVDRRTDIFSLGVVLYELLTGVRPFDGESDHGTLMKLVQSEPPPLRTYYPDAPSELESCVQKALSKKPAQRYADCEAFARELAQVTRSSGTVWDDDPTLPLKRRSASGTNSRSAIRFILPMLEDKPLWVLVPAAAAVLLFLSALAWFLFRGPERPVGNFIALGVNGKSAVEPARMTEYMLERMLSDVTSVPVIGDKDLAAYENSLKTAQTPLLKVQAEVDPSLVGFRVHLEVTHEGTTASKEFDCRGLHDLVNSKASEMLAYVDQVTRKSLLRATPGRDFTQISTSNIDALRSFLTGDAAWKKLDTQKASSGFLSAVELDSDFSLAYLKLAEIAMFRSDPTLAAEHLSRAQQKQERLIHYDVLQLKALEARIHSQPAEERKYLLQLSEAFPLSREYHYEFAESYFHCGDGEEAIKHYLKALRLDPDYALAHNHIAFCYAWIGDHRKAAEHFTRYISLDNTPNSYDSQASGFMFSGQHDMAIAALKRGLQLDPTVDYIHGNMATNLLLAGELSNAARSWEEQMRLAADPSTVVNARFRLAFLEFLRSRLPAATSLLEEVRKYYQAPLYQDRLDESPILPFWLQGVMAAERGDLKQLQATIGFLEKRIQNFRVNATNYFPILKFCLHLKALQAAAQRDTEALQRLVEEGLRIKNRMGYWSSMYDRAFFLEEYARLLAQQRNTTRALALLDDVLAYNPNYASALIRKGLLLAETNRREEAQSLLSQARKQLAAADPDYRLSLELKKLAGLLGS